MYGQVNLTKIHEVTKVHINLSNYPVKTDVAIYDSMVDLTS